MHSVSTPSRNLSFLSRIVNKGKKHEGTRVPPISYISVVVGGLFDENISGYLDK